MTNDDRTVSRDELERLKQSGASPARAVLHIDGQMPHELVRRLVIGREPAHDDQVEAITLAGDPLVSKTHLAFDITSDGVVAIDLGSSNGTTITAGGTTCDVPTDAWTPVEAGASLTVGDTSIRVEFDASGHSGHVTPGMFTPPAAGIVTSVPGPAGAPTTTSCSSCGRQVVAGSRFCDGCGASTVAMAASAPPSSPPAVSGFPDGPVVTSPPPVATSWPGSAGAPQDLGRVTDDAVRVRSSSKRTMTIAAAGAVIVAVAAIGWLVLAGSDDDGPSATPLPRVADDVEERWSVDIDGANDATGSASSVFVMAVDDDDAEVVALDGGSGDEQWTVDVGRNVSYGFLVGVLDGVVIVEGCDFDAGCQLFGLDASSGDELWSDESEGRAYISSRGTFVTQESDSLDLVDPRDGKRIERIRGDRIVVDGEHAYVRDDDEIEVFDLRDLSKVFGPVDVDADSVGVLYQDGKLITGVEDELVVISADGTVDRESRTPADEIFQILPGPNGMVIVDTDDGVFGLDPVDGRAEEIWSANGSLSFGFVSADGPLVIVVDGQGDGSDAEVLDARTGDTKIDLRDYYESDRLIGSNGLVNLEYERDTEATAYRYSDGEEIWDDRFDGFLRAVDNGLVEIDDGDVRFYR